MIKKITILAVTVFSLNANAVTITDLFNSLKNQPISQEDKISVKKADLAKRSALDALYPKLNVIASYEHYNMPSSMRPVLPTETPYRLAHHEPLPFSQNISRIGFELNFPIFVKALYTIRDKARVLKLASVDKKRLNFIQREAQILGANATLKYLEKLTLALKAKKISLLQTKKDIKIKVKNGRAAGVELNKIDENINNINISQNKIDQSKNELKTLIYTLSGIRIKKSIDFHQIKRIKKDKIFALYPLEKSLKAAKYGVKASKESLYPALFLNANYFESYAEGYNNNQNINTGYGSIGLKVVMPLFDKSKYTNIQKAKVAYESKVLAIAETKQTLSAKAKKLEEDLRLLKTSRVLAKKSVNNSIQLLKVAKVAFSVKRLSEEEFLRYENALVSAKAALYEIDAKKWQDIAGLAVIYGNDLEEVVK